MPALVPVRCTLSVSTVARWGGDGGILDVVVGNAVRCAAVVLVVVAEVAVVSVAYLGAVAPIAALMSSS